MIRIAMAGICALAAAQGAAALALEEVAFQDAIGTGANRAYLVIDWNAGTEADSYAWEYRWDGAATGRDMLDAVAAGWDDLYESPDNFGGAVVYGLGYDVDGDGFDTTVLAAGETGGTSDPDDLYESGWLSRGYWSYWASDDGVDWNFAPAGIGTRALSDGDWDGISWAPGFSGTAPDVPTATTAVVPEPATIALFGLGLAGAAWRRTRCVSHQ